jgi:hypothetical protein
MLAQYGGCADTGGVTRVAGTGGDSLDDFRCFDLDTDRYNFQPVNLVLTPQERASVFSSPISISTTVWRPTRRSSTTARHRAMRSRHCRSTHSPMTS